MNWAIERDSDGQPVRLRYVGPQMPVLHPPREPKPAQCKSCGYPSGWHKRDCERRSSNSAGNP